MSFRAKLIWKVFGRITGADPSYRIGRVDVFDIRTGYNFLRDAGGKVATTLTPLVLEPTNIFYNGLRPAVPNETLHGKKFPFARLFPEDGPTSASPLTNFGIHVYGRQVCIIVRTDSFDAPKDTNFFALQDLSLHASVLRITKRIFSIVNSRGQYAADFDGDLKIYPCIQILAETGADEIPHARLAQFLARNEDADYQVVSEILEKNHNQKTGSTVLLCDRQGIVAYASMLSSERERSVLMRRFKSAAALLELAASAQLLLNDPLPIRQDQLNSIRNLVHRSDLIFSDSAFTNTLWQQFAREFGLNHSLAHRALRH